MSALARVSILIFKVALDMIFNAKKRQKVIAIVLAICFLMLAIIYYMIFEPWVLFEAASKSVLNFFIDLFSPITGYGSGNEVFPIPYEFNYSYSNDYGNPRYRPGGVGTHQGNDIMAEEGTPIVAMKSGEITQIGWNTNGGWRIGITDENHYYWFYAHMKLDHPYAKGMELGKEVKAGDVIGYVGHTGYSSKLHADAMPDDPLAGRAENGNFVSHLHLSIYNEKHVTINPYNKLKYLEQSKSYVVVKKDGDEYLFDSLYGVKNKNEFIDKMEAEISNVEHKELGLLKSVTVAQAALESAWGGSGLTATANNLFGIKDHENDYWTGPYVEMSSNEEINGVDQPIVSKFRKYDSWKASIKDRIKFLQTYKRYSKVFEAEDYMEQARELQKAGWATDSSYSEQIISIIDEYGLDSLDSRNYGPIVFNDIRRNYFVLQLQK